VSAVISDMLAMNRDSSSRFFKAIDNDKIGVFGGLLGGWTAQVACGASSEGQTLKDPRIKAGVLWAPAPLPIDTSSITVPCMYMVGAGDEIVKLNATNLQCYVSAPSPKSLVVINKKCGHTSFTGTQCLVDQCPTEETCLELSKIVNVIARYTYYFFNTHLRNDLDAERKLFQDDPQFDRHEIKY
jgi:hypothetical protein